MSINRLAVATAVDAAQAALARCTADGFRVSVFIVDRSGVTQVSLRGDGAGPQTEESARRKAFTAVSFGAPTSELAARVTAPGATLRDIPDTLFLGGGVPVRFGGEAIAGIGVGGAPSGDADETCARAGLDAVADRLG